MSFLKTNTSLTPVDDRVGIRVGKVLVVSSRELASLLRVAMSKVGIVTIPWIIPLTEEFIVTSTFCRMYARQLSLIVEDVNQSFRRAADKGNER